MYKDLGSKLNQAITAGMDYLSKVVEADGAWPAQVFVTHNPLDGMTRHHPPFVAAFGALALAVSQHPDAAPLRERTLAFLRACRESTGLWRYAPFVPPDADDTSVCGLALAEDDLDNAPLATGPQDEEGRFFTWMPAPEDEVTLFNEPDAVVNANVIACLGDRAETRAAQRWLERLVAASPSEQEDALHYYPHALDLHIAIARLIEVQAPLFEHLREPVLRQLLAGQDETGAFIDALRTAQALSALDRLGALDQTEVVRPAVERILNWQHGHGAWPACLAWIGGPGQPFGFETAPLSTACCIEALERVSQHG